jgi:hypothetical protein
MKIRDIVKAARCGNEKGQVIVWTALMAIVLFGFVALAIDGGFFFQHKRRMQTAADSAAVAGAYEIRRDTEINQTALEVVARHDATLNGFSHGSDNVSVAVFRPPTSGTYIGDNSYVEAIVTHQHRTFFARVLNLLGSGINFNTATVRARAVAGGVTRDCIYVLDPDDEKAFEISSGSGVDARCGVQVNSDDNKALSVTSGSSLDATSIDVKGDYEASGSVVSPDPNTGAPVESDPLADLLPPPIPACNGVPRLVEGTKTLDPGHYCQGIELNSANVTFRPGIYVLNGGLKVKSGSTAQGTQVAFYNTQSPAGPISIESNSTVKFSAPTSGPMAGILFFQDRALSSDPSLDASIASGISSFFTGALYFPKNKLRFHSGTHVNSAAQWTVIVARLLEVSSNTTLHVNADSPLNPLAKTTLVE